MTAPVNSYDAVPYISEPFRQSHPNHLAAIACLLGLAPPAVETARVLEIGCASGGNLIPLAITLPRARLVGIDYSARQIADGQRTIATLGLDTVELRAESILDVGAELGTFDYIIAHGVYSWVPDAVQARLLALVGEVLAPTGVAYISYNVLPGWYTHRGLREALLFHGRKFPEPADRLRQSRALLQFLADANQSDEGPFRQYLQQEIASIQKLPDAYLFHDHLEEQNAPVHFHEFVARARPHGLAYLGDADFHAMFVENLPAEVQQVLRHISADAIEQEQYMDFLRNRMFRQTLLCRAGQAPDQAIGPDRLARLRVASRLRPGSAPEALRTSEPVEFANPKGLSITLSAPYLKTALGLLADAWPGSIGFDDLRRQAREALSPGDGLAMATADARQLAGALVQLYRQSSVDWVELTLAPSRADRTGGVRPMASPLARHQAGLGPTVTTLRHDTVRLDELARAVLLLLDGSLDRAGLERVAEERHGRGDWPVLPVPPERVGTSERQWRSECVLGTLGELGASSLLMKPA